MRFRLTPTVYDLELLYVRNFSQFRVISVIWEATMAKRIR